MYIFSTLALYMKQILCKHRYEQLEECGLFSNT